MTPSNSSYTVNELVYQLQASNAKAIIAHPSFFKTITEAAKKASIPKDRIIFLHDRRVGLPSAFAHQTVDGFITFGRDKGETFVSRKLRPGEGKTKLAFLSFSSGTTGMHFVE